MKTILALLPFEYGFARDVFRGMSDALALHPDWSLHPGNVRDLRYYLEHRRPLDGVIGFLRAEETARLAARAARVAINISNGGVGPPPPFLHNILNDDRAIGAAAARFFLDRGYRRIYFLEWGVGDWQLAVERWEGLAEAAAAAGARAERGVALETRPLVAFLESMERPAALLVRSDSFASYALRELRRLGRAVPADVAVLGVDDDLLLDESSRPPLSSVRPAAARIGRVAVEWIVAGRSHRRPASLRLPPEGIVQRLSTDAFAVSDERLRKALAILDAEYRGPLDLASLARRSGVSRRHLGALFARHLRTTPSRWRENRRLQEARRLLAATALPIEEIAERIGYGGAVAFWRAFRGAEGIAPGAYRESFAAAASDRERKRGY